LIPNYTSDTFHYRLILRIFKHFC